MRRAGRRHGKSPAEAGLEYCEQSAAGARPLRTHNVDPGVSFPTQSHARKRGIKYRYYILLPCCRLELNKPGPSAGSLPMRLKLSSQNLFGGASMHPPRSRMQSSSTLMSFGSKSNRTSWSLSSPTQKLAAASGSKAVTSYRCPGARHYPPDIAKFSYPKLRSLDTPAQFVPSTVHSLSHRLRGDAAGSTNSFATPLRLPKASPDVFEPGNARKLRAVCQRPGNAGSHRTASWNRENRTCNQTVIEPALAGL